MDELINYRLLRNTQDQLPPIKGLYEYVVAANGVFLRAKREGLEVLFPIMQPGRPTHTVRGLQLAYPYIKLDRPKVPRHLLIEMLRLAQGARNESGHVVEILFHLLWNTNEDRWELVVPEQVQQPAACYPVGQSVGAGSSFDKALVDLHSHHGMSAFFSATDDKDEQGFRIYAVIGRIFDNGRREIRVRVGVYGIHYEFAASEVFELDGGIEVADSNFYDCNAAKQSCLPGDPQTDKAGQRYEPVEAAAEAEAEDTEADIAERRVSPDPSWLVVSLPNTSFKAVVPALLFDPEETNIEEWFSQFFTSNPLSASTGDGALDHVEPIYLEGLQKSGN